MSVLHHQLRNTIFCFAFSKIELSIAIDYEPIQSTIHIFDLSFPLLKLK
jgi:hypothetical protein